MPNAALLHFEKSFFGGDHGPYIQSWRGLVFYYFNLNVGHARAPFQQVRVQLFVFPKSYTREREKLIDNAICSFLTAGIEFLPSSNRAMH